MNESNQPFTDHVTRKKSPARGRLAGWITAGVAALLAALFLTLWQAGKNDHRYELAALQAKLKETESKLAKAGADHQAHVDKIESLQRQIGDLQKEKEMAVQSSKSLEDEMRSALESKDVTISKLQGKLTVNILDRIMFDSGEAVLKPDGEAVMRKIAGLLAEHPQLKIHVIGHTDNIPIRSSARSRFASNWELSAARALAAVHFLVEQTGVDPHRVGALAYGEFRPVADNATAEGRAKNRRIAITILSDELVGAEPTPEPGPAVEANSQPPPTGTNAPAF
ncbi:MAG TPA: OmpA family protein [Candidatus Paceibacterota bacterium]|nr:OmpA family protein [Candidatus Paceibacterota bacterium]